MKPDQLSNSLLGVAAIFLTESAVIATEKLADGLF